MDKISEKNLIELGKVLAEKIGELRKFRFDMSGSKIKNVRLGRLLRREIARVRTEMASRKKDK